METVVWQEGCVVLDEDRYLAGAGDLSECLNHSCEPNLWMADAVTLVVRRDIAAGEEVTIDYSLFECDESWVARWSCRCGAPACRRDGTGLARRGPPGAIWGALLAVPPRAHPPAPSALDCAMRPAAKVALVAFPVGFALQLAAQLVAAK